MNPNLILDPLETIECTIAFSSRDMSTDKRDAWIYGIVLGWDKSSMKQMQEKHNWSDNAIRRLRILHKNYKMIKKESVKRFPEEFKIK